MAVKVVRIRPRRYSAVMNIVATTIITISATMSPNGRRVGRGVAAQDREATAGAMSPDPLSTNASPERWTLPVPSVG